MGWIPFETENAKYILVLEKHSKRWEKVPHEFDIHIKEWHSEPLEFLADERFAREEKKLIEKNIDFFIVDPIKIPTGHTIIRGELLSGDALTFLGASKLINNIIENKKIGLTSLAMIGLGNIITPIVSFPLAIKGKIKLRKPLVNITSFLSNLIPTTSVALVNALAADAVEEIIAPKLAQKLKRKPVILIQYGAGHAGIKKMIQKPKTRKRVLKLYEKSFRWIFTEKGLKHIHSFRWNKEKQEWKIEEIPRDLKIPKKEKKIRILLKKFLPRKVRA
ncbi:MAG: hypothetical protein AB1467_00885 [Candidatus Diapherotrites archaeon]